MKLALRLFVREHRTGAFTIQVLGRADLVVFTEDLARGQEELSLAIADRIERTHPSLQSTFAAAPELRLETVRLEEGLRVGGVTREERRPLELTMLVSSRRGWTSVWFPRLDLHGWFSKKQDYGKAAQALLHQHVERLPAPARLAVRGERREWIEPLAIEVEPAPLSAFALRGTAMLPAPGSEAEEETPAEKAERQAQEKKRPPTPTLAKVGVPLHELAQRGELDRAYGRSRELAELEALLGARGHKAIVLVGASGGGKSALIYELVCRMARADKPDDVRPVWFADAPRLVATSGFGTDWQRQTLDVIEEAHAADVVWSIGSLVRLLDAGKHVYSEHNVAAVLRPYLGAKRVTVIGECTPAEWAALELRDVAFARCFIPYRMEDPPPEELRAILKAVGAELFPRHDVSEAVEAARELAARYLVRKSVLGAAVQLLRRAADAVASKTTTSKTTPTNLVPDVPLRRVDVARHFCSETGLPELLVRDDLPLDPAAVRAFFEARLIGQPEAVARMVDLIAVIKSGLPDPRRPLGTFLFVGPTGVGKTETAKALAAFLYGSERRLVRFDMSEYLAGDAVSRFLGDARSEGKLVEAVRRQPFTVLLLDEIEKAHPAIFDVLLAVLGEARLTDEAGRTADFKNVVIVMTSNLGVEAMKAGLGFGDGPATAADQRAHFGKAVEAFFRPELFNRIDHVVPFRPLGPVAIEGIARRQLELLRGREGLRQRGLELEVPDVVRAFLAERGVDARYGARPLKRAIERRLTMPLARHLSTARPTDAALEVQVEGEALVFAPARPKAGPDRGAKRALQGLHDRVDKLRFRLDRWRETPRYKDLAEEVRLLEKLSASPKFWKERELAEARVAGLQGKRQLIDDLTGYGRELDGLVQLLVEAHHRRDTQAVPIAEEGAESLRARLEPLELRLAGADLIEPESVTLTLFLGADARGLLKRLVFAYGQLAEQYGWAVTAHCAVVIAPETEPVEPPRTKPGKAADDTQVARAPKRKRPKEKRVRWTEVGDRERTVEGDDPDAATEKLWREMAGADAIALWVRGPHAAVRLRHETGAHLVSDGKDSAEVKVVVHHGSAEVVLPHPDDVMAQASVPCRTIHETKKQVIDHASELTLPMEARLSRPYARLMKARLLLDALGARARPWLRGWEA